MYLSRRKRLQWRRVLFFVSGVLLCCIYHLSLRARRIEPWPEAQVAEYPDEVEKPSAETTTPVMEVSNHTVVENFTETTTTGMTTETTRESTRETTIKTTRETTREPTKETTIETTTETAIETTTETTTELATSQTTNRTNLRHCIYVDPEPSKTTAAPTLTPFPNTTTPMPNTTLPSPGKAPRMKGEYPVDLFSVEQRRQGWVLLHIFGMVYMFVSLAIVCDEFFVPALGVITDKLAISDDVAGATFMAAGGSAPELFTSLIGVFIAHSNVGIGTIVGSAVFNILFVIGMCALSSREMLHLTWWPLFRDVSFYILDLILLIIFFLDNTIMWWESLMLVTAYCSYVLFMKYNVQLERAFKTQLSKHQNMMKIFTLEEPDKDNGSQSSGGNKPENQEAKNHLLPPLQRGSSSASLHNSTMRSTILQLMIHSLDPLGEVRLKDKAEILKTMAQRKEAEKEEEKKEDTPSKPEPPAKEEEEKPGQEEGEKEGVGSGGAGGSGGPGGSEGSGSSSEDDSDDDNDDDSDEDDEEDDDEEEGEEPLSLEWPDTWRKKATYLFLLPIVYPLWLTVPDVRRAASKKYFAVTFLGSILWIGVFSYMMAWWAHQVGETIGISEEIMGLTILAAGTSIPDLITSVIVARKGLGDMAVSSSVGSNIFDITVGLPVPWLLYSTSHSMSPVAVSSNGLFCAIVLLFLMLLFVILSIAFCKWKMNKVLGSTMFLLYFIFLLLSVLLEDRIIVCPVSI